MPDQEKWLQLHWWLLLCSAACESTLFSLKQPVLDCISEHQWQFKSLGTGMKKTAFLPRLVCRDKPNTVEKEKKKGSECK